MKLFNAQLKAGKTKMKGIIFKIKRFSIHDGPGIRTSIFLKGCPLKCIWCHSPEGISPATSIWYDNKSCISCGECVRVCRNDALKHVLEADYHIVINYSKCTLNGDCVKICPTGAISLNGSSMTIDEVIKEIEKDLLYYKVSNGGVTFTGGEPLYQSGFLLNVLKECSRKSIHTAIETSLFCDKKILMDIAEFTDLFITDLKIYERGNHIRFTGQPNDIIKENFSILAKAGLNILVRVPLIEGITDSNENKNAITDFVNSLNPAIPIEFIVSNPLAGNNYKKLGLPFLSRDEHHDFEPIR